MNPLQLADVLDEFATNPKGGKIAAIAYKKAAHLIREKLVRNNDTDFGQVLAENQRLRDRLGPRGLEVVFIDGNGHYLNEAVKVEIERLRDLLRRAVSYGNIEPQLDIEIAAALANHALTIPILERRER